MAPMAQVVVRAPVRSASPYGLYSVAGVTDSANEHIAQGVVYQVVCGSADAWNDPCFTDESPGDKIENVDVEAVNGEPFVVYADNRCPPITGDIDPGEAVRLILEGTEQVVTERRLWQSFADCQSPAEATGGLAETVGAVETELAQQYGRGVLHVPTYLYPFLSEANLIVRTGEGLETPYGTPLVLGAGYVGQPGVGTGASTWIVGTGGVYVDRTAVQMVEAFDTSVNNRHVLAERTVTVSYECLCVAAQVTLPA